MPIVRKRLEPKDLYPEDVRYNSATDTVQRLVDGEWVDNPESDPRQQILYPPRTTSDPRCDAAENVANAFMGKINEVIGAIDGGITALQIAGLILGLFSFGVFAVVFEIALFIADLMLSIGSEALLEEIDPEALEQFKCIVYCHMDENGRVDHEAIGQILDEIDAEMSTIQQLVFGNMIALAGFGGVSNLGAIGDAVGDCDDCECDEAWCYEFNFLGSDEGWVHLPLTGGFNIGDWNAGIGWTHTDVQNVQTGIQTAHRGLQIQRSFSSAIITEISVTYDFTGGSYDNTSVNAFSLNAEAINRIATTRAAMVNGTNLVATWTPPSPVTLTNVSLFIRSSRDITAPLAYSGSCGVPKITFKGTGFNPFGDSNCEP